MTSSSLPLSLDLDLGELWRRERSWFVVRLDASPLFELITAAKAGLRVYELATLRRPGDLAAYVDVRPISLPPGVLDQASAALRFQRPEEVRMRLERFDTFFPWVGEDDHPVGTAWRAQWNGPATRHFLGALYEHVRCSVGSLAEGDLLLQHELRRIAENRHAYDTWPLARVRGLADTMQWPDPKQVRYTASFYAMLDRLLQRPEVEAVAYRDDGIYRVLRSLCLEQRRRADASGRKPSEALCLSALTDLYIDNSAWDSELRLYDEGIGWGDLFVDGDGELGAPLRLLHGTRWQRFGRWVLSARDLGHFEGYACECGDGWFLYEALPSTAIPRPPRDFW